MTQLSHGNPAPYPDESGTIRHPSAASGKRPLIITIVVLVVILACTGVTLKLTGVFGSGKAAPKPSHVAVDWGGPGEARKLWAAPAIGTVNDPFHGWLVDEHTVAYATTSGLAGYDLDSGKQIWQLPESNICAMSPTIDGGIGAIGLASNPSDHANCDTAAAVDLTDGRLLWSVNQLTLLPEIGAPTSGALSVANGMVIVEDFRKNMLGYGARDGQRKWAVPVPTGDYCTQIYVLAEGGETVQVQDCQRDGITVSTYDTASGGMKGTVKMSSTDTFGDRLLPLSVHPLVVVNYHGIYYLRDPNTAPIPLQVPPETDLSRWVDGIQTSEAFDSTSMCAVAPDPDDDLTPSLTCYDLATGQARWSHEFEHLADVRAIGMSQGKLWIDYTGIEKEHHQLLSFSQADGAMTKETTFTVDNYALAYNLVGLTAQLAGNKIVEFGPPFAPVTVWDRG
ncbi:hypothetical protein Atai01_11320 [Amycolatopsis taiwanensis]|uniref:Pyrrolo-quinoline quinone repeat domain-containing protein n=1 Tax=Amycolatopsis taiwanensis TaxID=342230 RepID=A0A9W6QXV3_9PSEU|nr:hypothetical protein Atai01_11320 [Amycolatopsis taiwanensis]